MKLLGIGLYELGSNWLTRIEAICVKYGCQLSINSSVVTRIFLTNWLATVSIWRIVFVGCSMFYYVMYATYWSTRDGVACMQKMQRFSNDFKWLHLIINFFINAAMSWLYGDLITRYYFIQPYSTRRLPNTQQESYPRPCDHLVRFFPCTIPL